MGEFPDNSSSWRTFVSMARVPTALSKPTKLHFPPDCRLGAISYIPFDPDGFFGEIISALQILMFQPQPTIKPMPSNTYCMVCWTYIFDLPRLLGLGTTQYMLPIMRSEWINMISNSLRMIHHHQFAMRCLLQGADGLSASNIARLKKLASSVRCIFRE